MQKDEMNPQQRVERLFHAYSAATGDQPRQAEITQEIVGLFSSLSLIEQGELMRRFEAESVFADKSFLSLRDFPEGPATDKSTPGSRVSRTPGLDIQERHPSQR